MLDLCVVHVSSTTTTHRSPRVRQLNRSLSRLLPYLSGQRTDGASRSAYPPPVDEWDPKRESVSLKAVYDEQLTGYLRSLGLDPEGVLGVCKFDGTAVTLDNLTALFPLSGSLKLVCSNRQCLEGLQDLIREGVVRL